MNLWPAPEAEINIFLGELVGKWLPGVRALGQQKALPMEEDAAHVLRSQYRQVDVDSGQ